MNHLGLHSPHIDAGGENDRKRVMKVELRTAIATRRKVVDEAIGVHTIGNEFHFTDLMRVGSFGARSLHIGQRAEIDGDLLPDFARTRKDADVQQRAVAREVFRQEAIECRPLIGGWLVRKRRHNLVRFFFRRLVTGDTARHLEIGETLAAETFRLLVERRLIDRDSERRPPRGGKELVAEDRVHHVRAGGNQLPRNVGGQIPCASGDSSVSSAVSRSTVPSPGWPMLLSHNSCGDHNPVTGFECRKRAEIGGQRMLSTSGECRVRICHNQLVDVRLVKPGDLSAGRNS